MVRVDTIHYIRPRMEEDILCQSFVPRTDAIAEAYRWGKIIHAGQKRLSGEPYFETHCAWVASFIDRLVQNEVWTIAALLHDSIEDRGGSLDEIRRHFPGSIGEQVANTVDGVTKLVTSRDGRSGEIETLRKIAMFRDPGVFLVKLADKTHNVMTLQYMPSEKREYKAREAIRAYGKLAGILNCYKWRRWLEDMAFPHGDPSIYPSVKTKIDSDPRLQLNFINQMVRQLGDVMEKEGVNGSVEISVNGYWQAWEKLRRMARMRKTSLDTFADVNDLISFRLIVDSNDIRECYILLSGVNRFLGPYIDQNRFDDYIASPQNGYRALQSTAWLAGLGAIEVAIATREMECENLWGIVYSIQKGKDISEYIPVTILTPTGGVRFVPEGATVLDAVASIQQEFLLDKVSAVKVNDRLSNLYDKVNPGDVVEVVTDGIRLVPSNDWLNYCNPTTARLLRVALATEGLRKAAETGKQRIKSLLSDRGVLDLEDVRALETSKFDQLLGQLICANLEDLYAAVGGGAIQVTDVAYELDQVGISKTTLKWSTILLTGPSGENRPGTLVKLAGIVSKEGGNIIRMLEDTHSDGGFVVRIVAKNLDPMSFNHLIQAYKTSDVKLDTIELV